MLLCCLAFLLALLASLGLYALLLRPKLSRFSAWQEESPSNLMGVAHLNPLFCLLWAEREPAVQLVPRRRLEHNVLRFVLQDLIAVQNNAKFVTDYLTQLGLKKGSRIRFNLRRFRLAWTPLEVSHLFRIC